MPETTTISPVREGVAYRVYIGPRATEVLVCVNVLAPDPETARSLARASAARYGLLECDLFTMYTEALSESEVDADELLRLAIIRKPLTIWSVMYSNNGRLTLGGFPDDHPKCREIADQPDYHVRYRTLPQQIVLPSEKVI